MNIVTVDMVEEQKQAAKNQAEEYKCCNDSDCDNSIERYKYTAINAQGAMIQQQTTTLNPGTATVCSCSGCMASQTAYMP